MTTTRRNVLGPRRKSKARLESVNLDSDAALDALVADAGPDPTDPPYDAYRLRMQGVPWPDVARRTGYGSPRSAAMAVSGYLQKAAALQSAAHQQEALQMEVDRYEAILTPWWEAGTTGRDDKAAGILLRTLERLDRVLRLTEGDAVVTKETIVISADPATYVAQLQQVVADRRGTKALPAAPEREP